MYLATHITYKVSDVEQHVFYFTLIDHKLVLDQYNLEQRQTKRHRFSAISVYSRLRSFPAHPKLRYSEVPFDRFPDVVERAKQSLLDQIVFVEGKD